MLQPQEQHQGEDLQAGLRVRTLEIGWDHYEPRDGGWNQAYIDEQRQKYRRMADAGALVVLDLGLQYPPDWVLSYPDSRYVNQYGDSFAGGLGDNGVNAVFNQRMRDLQARYIQRVFADLGTGFYAVRVGGGSYGELKYPASSYNGHANSYWAYDRIAQGQAPGLPAGVTPSPVPGWAPGTPSPNHSAASAFISWYIDSLANYQTFQIATVRSAYPGTILVLYPSWGVRPGQLEAAAAADLAGTTSTEINGELQAGLELARLVAAINDPQVAVYTTWLNAPNAGDGSADQRDWSPAHYLSSLAAAHPLRLRTWGENAGRNGAADLDLCVGQVRQYGLAGMLWAFEADLHAGGYATLADYRRAISLP